MLTAWHSVAIPADPLLQWKIHPHRVPRERMEVLNLQLEGLMTDMPLGEIDSPPNRSELAAWLAWYEDLDRYGGDQPLVMLMDGDAVAAMCETAWDERCPDRVEQKLTAVTCRWRGRGFGKAVKAAMLRLIRERHPEVRTITTSNANVNAPILSINARLGFVEHRRTATYQIGRDALSDGLRRRAGPR